MDENLTRRELATVLAALRLRQYQLDARRGSEWLPDLEDVATNLGAHEALTAEEIDGLCERLQAGGQTG